SPVSEDAHIALTDGEPPWPDDDEARNLPPTITVLTPNGDEPPTYMGQWVKLGDGRLKIED
ncbi:hypothetical protein, partial [Listeria monocytogenes]|uniref:hypothetical protein n=1 Tax=Listeria monocytogenes TaxID=1639 RepID=UPI001A7E30A1